MTLAEAEALVRAVLVEVAGLDPALDPALDVVDAGLVDSLVAIEIVVTLEERARVAIPDERYDACASIAGAAALLVELTRSR